MSWLRGLWDGHRHWFTLPRKLGWRRAVGEWLRWIGDKIAPKDAICPTHMRVRLVKHQGWVMDVDRPDRGRIVHLRRSDHERGWDDFEVTGPEFGGPAAVAKYLRDRP